MGGYGCNTDLRANISFAADDIRIHTTAQQSNTYFGVKKSILCPQWNTTLGMTKAKQKEYTTLVDNERTRPHTRS